MKEASNKNTNLFYCIKKNEHHSYTCDYQKFLRRKQSLGEAGVEYGVFCTKKDAMAFLGLSYNDPSELTIEERRVIRAKKRANRVAKIQEQMAERRAQRESRRKKFYAVARGYHQKICFSWEEAKEEIFGYAFPQYLGCDTIEEASAFVKAFNAKYRGMTEKEITTALRNEKLEKLARKRKHMSKKDYYLARDRILNKQTKDKKVYDEKYVPYQVHLGPRTPEEAERQYRKHVYVGNSTCWKLAYQRAPKKAS